MTTVRFDSAAENDILDIKDEIARDRPVAAERMLLKLQSTAASLAHFPLRHARRHDVPGDVRSVPVGPYLIFYEYLPDENVVRVRRVLHGARDLPALFRS